MVLLLASMPSQIRTQGRRPRHQMLQVPQLQLCILFTDTFAYEQYPHTLATQCLGS